MMTNGTILKQFDEAQMKGLRRAMACMQGAPNRWEERAKTGLTDSELKEALSFELGAFGGVSCSDYQVSHINTPISIFLGSTCARLAPGVRVVKGAELLKVARAIWNVQEPGSQYSLPM